MAVEIERRAGCLDEASRKCIRIIRLFEARLKNCEFVPAQSGECVAFTQASAHSFSDLPQQLITNRMSQRVVDAFEAVNIETEDCKFAISRQACKPIFYFALGITAGWAGS